MAGLTINYALGNVKNIFKDGNIYMTGQNIFIITKYPSFSPETKLNASVNSILPSELMHRITHRQGR